MHVEEAAALDLVQAAAVEVGIGQEARDARHLFEPGDEARRVQGLDRRLRLRPHELEAGQAGLALVVVIVGGPVLVRVAELGEQGIRRLRRQEIVEHDMRIGRGRGESRPERRRLPLEPFEIDDLHGAKLRPSPL